MTATHLIIQTCGSYEVRSMLGYATKRDIRVTRSSAMGLQKHRELLDAGALPIGSVEFVRQAMIVASIKAPGTLSYPKELRDFLYRNVECIPLYELDRLPHDEFFVKPAGAVKLFDGFVFSSKPAEDPAEEEFRQEQRKLLGQLPPATPLFVSPLVSFESEWRIYVHKHKIVGRARYDDGPDDVKAPAETAIKNMMRSYRREGNAPVAYALDVGVLKNKKTALVEVNDAWALGLYRDMDDHEAYLNMLSHRWIQIRTGKSPK